MGAGNDCRLGLIPRIPWVPGLKHQHCSCLQHSSLYIWHESRCDMACISALVWFQIPVKVFYDQCQSEKSLVLIFLRHPHLLLSCNLVKKEEDFIKRLLVPSICGLSVDNIWCCGGVTLLSYYVLYNHHQLFGLLNAFSKMGYFVMLK